MINIKRITKEQMLTSWADLKERASVGKLDEFLRSGDTIDITLKNGEAVTLMIGKDKKGTIYFASKDCLVQPHVMNNVRTCKGGWAKTEMRRYLNEEIFSLLPDELQTVVKPTTIVQIVDNERLEEEDKLFCFSSTQVFGFNNSVHEPEDTQIDIFAKTENRIKKCASSKTYWCLRSLDEVNDKFFCSVNFGGDSHSIGACVSGGVAFGFTI